MNVKAKTLFLSLYKGFLKIINEIIFYIQKTPQIIGGFVLLFGFISFIQISIQGYFVPAIKMFLAFLVLSTAVYYACTMIYKLFGGQIVKIAEKISEKQHEVNCGLYMAKYQSQINKMDDIDKMLMAKELLETNIILSSLKHKAKSFFTENNILNYTNILTNGLEVGNALCFSTNNLQKKNDMSNFDFVIDEDAFIKEFDEFCQGNPNDLEKQIDFMKKRQREIKKELNN